jgi:hypothetical protein
VPTGSGKGSSSDIWFCSGERGNGVSRSLKQKIAVQLLAAAVIRGQLFLIGIFELLLYITMLTAFLIAQSHESAALFMN